MRTGTGFVLVSKQELGGRTISSRLKSLVAVVVVWNVCCLAVMLIYRPTVGRAVDAAYTRSFGDIQASFGRYERIATYLGIILVTTPATAVSLGLLNALMPRPRRWRSTVVTFGAWQVGVVAALVWSYEAGFPYMVNRLDWTLFGPSEVYSLRNLVLPRIIAWIVCTMPPIWAACWLHSGLKRPERGRPHPTKGGAPDQDIG
jgi:ribose/xylose/arabinose/galactoside ABC-type transport system permease subunit